MFLSNLRNHKKEVREYAARASFFRMSKKIFHFWEAGLSKAGTLFREKRGDLSFFKRNASSPRRVVRGECRPRPPTDFLIAETTKAPKKPSRIAFTIKRK